MSVCLLRIADGRDDYHEAAWASAVEMLPQVEHVVTVDDREHRLGFAGAIADGWRQVIDTGADYCLHLEMDFTFNQPVPLERIIAVLERRPYLAQICLKRQAVNAQERAAGGIVECAPENYLQVVDRGDIWTEHRCCFSTNPCVYPVALCHQGWPQVEQSEGIFTHRLLEDPDCRFAFWGAKYDPPMVEHIGHERTGCGY